MIHNYEKRVRRLVSIMVMFLNTEWAQFTFVDRIEALRSIVSWFDQLRTGKLIDPSVLHGMPLAYDLAISVSELRGRSKNAHAVDLKSMIDNMYMVFSFFLNIFVRERFYMTDHTLSHTPHDPGTLFDNVVGE